jgi:hypothetical protein
LRAPALAWAFPNPANLRSRNDSGEQHGQQQGALPRVLPGFGLSVPEALAAFRLLFLK